MINGLFLLSLLTGARAAGEADRVFFLVLDGLRADEGVDAEDTWLPYVWLEARPRGGLLRHVENRGTTQTDGAPRGIMTGRRQPLPQLPWYPGRTLQRVWTPTLTEVIGAARTCQTPGGYILGNTVFMDSQGRSLYPTYAACGAEEATTEENSTWSDAEILDLALSEITAHHGLVLLNIHEPDKRAHAGIWDGYTEGILGADALIEMITARALPTDAFFVFSDHGRHLGEDWAGHGDSCSGCRGSWLLAYGAGVAEGVEVSEGYELEDLAPTAAHLLGIDYPWARGRVISEILMNPPLPAMWEDALVDPVIARDAGGELHQIAGVLTSAEGDGELAYRRTVGGEWAGWERFGSEQVVPELPTIAATGDAVVRAWRAWQTDLLEWGLFAQTSTDGGETWSEVERVSEEIPFYARLQLTGTEEGATLLRSADTEHSADEEADLVLSRYSGGAWSEQTIDGEALFHQPTQLSTVYVPSAGTIGAFAAIPTENYDPPEDDDVDNPGNENRDIYVVTGLDDGALGAVRVTQTDGVSYWPSMAADAAGTLYLAWAERSGALTDGRWATLAAWSDNGGQTWSEPITLNDGQIDAWRPVVVGLDDSAQVLWTEIDEMSHNIAHANLSGGAATAPRFVVTIDAVIEQVSAVADAGQIVMTWGEVGATHSVQTSTIVPGDGPGHGPPVTLDDAPITDEELPTYCSNCTGSRAGVLLGLGALLVGVRRRR